MNNPVAVKKAESGFTLIEVILTFSILAVATTALGLVEVSSSNRQKDLKARDIAFARGQAFLERILRMPFGPPNPAPMSPTQYDQLFGSDQDVRNLTLTQLMRRDTDGDGAVDGTVLQFRLDGVEDAGLWEIHVDNDLDGNGLVEPIVDGVETREGRTDLLRIEILRDERTVIRTIRARTPQEQDASGNPLE